MSAAIVPLHRRRGAQTSLARVDTAAVGLLNSGQAVNLQDARAEVILTDLQTQRDQLAVVLEDLRRQEPSSDIQIREADANLLAAVEAGIGQIDHFIARAKTFAGLTVHPRGEPPSAEA